MITRLALGTSVMLALLLPGSALAKPAPASAAPAAPTAVYASSTCDDPILDGVVWCTLEVSWPAVTDDGGSPIMSFTVTGNVSDRPTTVGASGAAVVGGYGLSWRWNRVTNADRGADASYTVTAANAAGTSAPATVDVTTDFGQPSRGILLRTADNGAKNDVLGLLLPQGSPSVVTVRINGKRHVVRTTHGAAELILKDRNGRRPTLYTARYGSFTKRGLAG